MDHTQPYPRARSPQARPARRAPAPARRRSNWGRRFAVALLLLAIAVAAVLVVLGQRAIAFNSAVSTESPVSMRLFGPFADGDRVNVLLLGYSDESRAGAYLSDSINVLSIERSSGVTSMIGIPRDLWVEGMPEVPDNMKINEAHRIGYYAGGLENGAELAAAAVTYVTGLEIDGWVSLDFQGFEAMVDAVGGVTVENPRAFAYTFTEAEFHAQDWDGSYEAGTLELNGREALTYARNRYTSVREESSDFARLVRQQRVLEAIRSEMRGLDVLPKALAVSEALEGHMRTNMSVADLAMLAGKLDPDRRIDLPEDVILRASTNSIGQYVLVVIGQVSPTDYRPLHAYVRSELAARLPTPSPSEPATP
jgi:polyisoprenyl-teichoic acid--peptidoglycan teichoic acid transferase